MLDYDNFTNKEISPGKSCHENNQLYSHRLGSIWNRSIFLLDWESTKKREYWIDSVSTGKIFYEASTQGIPIHSLDNPETLEADLAAISAYSNVKHHIQTYVNTGYTATIPQRNITVGSLVRARLDSS